MPSNQIMEMGDRILQDYAFSVQFIIAESLACFEESINQWMILLSDCNFYSSLWVCQWCCHCSDQEITDRYIPGSHFADLVEAEVNAQEEFWGSYFLWLLSITARLFMPPAWIDARMPSQPYEQILCMSGKTSSRNYYVFSQTVTLGVWLEPMCHLRTLYNSRRLCCISALRSIIELAKKLSQL